MPPTRRYLAAAIAKLKMRNDNPADTEAIYHMARLERLEGHLDKAYDLFWDAAWQYGWRSPSYYEIACIDLCRGNRALAMEHLELALETNARHFAARAILAYLRGNEDDLKAILDVAPQDGLTRFLLGRRSHAERLYAGPQRGHDRHCAGSGSRRAESRG